jgi:hypothetical protein
MKMKQLKEDEETSFQQNKTQIMNETGQKTKNKPILGVGSYNIR